MLKHGQWIKSTKSPSCDNSCVEVQLDGDTVYTRNSNVPGAGTVAYTTKEWAAFVAGVKAGEFDLPA